MAYSNFEIVADKVESELKEMFESKEKYGSKIINGLKAVYKKCMDVDELNRIGASRMIKQIRRFGVWPMLDGDNKWDEKKFDLTSLLIFVSRRRVNMFVNFKLTLDEKDVSRRLIEFDQGGITLPRRVYLMKHVYAGKINILKKFLVDKVMLFQKDGNVRRNRTKTEEDIDEIIDFEAKIAAIHAPPEARKDHEKFYHLRRLSKMRKYMPMIDWDRFFRKVAPAAAHHYFESDPQVLVREIAYLNSRSARSPQRLSSPISKLLNETDPRIITNYVFIRYSSALTKEMGERYDDVAQEYLRDMYGRQQKAPRWKDCTRSTMDLMKYATSAMYVRKAFDKEAKDVALNLTYDLQIAFRKTLKTTDWLHGPTKNRALHKAKRMLRKIAYPDFVLDDKKLDKHYEGLNVDENDSYGKMLEKIDKWDIAYLSERLAKPVDRSEYDFNAAEVNAYYDDITNSIKITAAILQAPFFHHTFPKALNYGGIGAVMAHEITHGFDVEGSQHDAYGNLHDWWDKSVKKNFRKRAQCFVDQYENIEVPGTNLSINGEVTQVENIADNGGVKQAYKAYKAYLQRNGGEEPRIKGLEKYNNDQMFFLGYAGIWCEHTTTQALVNQLLGDDHSPARYRVNQVLANQPEFAAAFKCKKGTPMNPKSSERCAIW
ncbi:unnamed protein product [Cylicocyclus nassatus]|uniref:Peptidase family M13 n=1 Tax=Cylicocyclus nassatus TaxID=53992 RepID=A0AA36M9I1_CYLNA|nr:unnamed protein product [Cylicocyclus nassatus]